MMNTLRHMEHFHIKHFLEKIILFFVCILLAGFVTAHMAEASSVIFTKGAVTVQVGRTFTLPVVINPEEIQQYTVRLAITFSPELFEVTSFAFGKDWIAVSQPGYDSVDNKRGELIKTAGFPKGFSSQTTFGTVTFRAKNAGESTIVVGPQSFVLDANNENTLQSGSQVEVAVVEGPAPLQPSVESPPGLPTTGQNVPLTAPVSGLEVSPSWMPSILPLGLALVLGIIALAIFIWLRGR